MKKFFFLFLSLFLLLNLCFESHAQTPQYYNYSTTIGANTFPFSVAAGKLIQFLYLPGDFAQPTPVPAGNQIVKFYWLHTSSASGGSGFYNNLTIRMGQTTDISLPTGAFYTGQLDTVFYADTISFTATVGKWNSVTLTRPFVYDPTLSLVVQISQCGMTLTGSMGTAHTTLTGYRRTYNQTAGGCNYIYQGQGGQILHAGIDVAPVTGTSQNGTNVPDVYDLRQNYPNPFNAVTKINYSLKEKGYVSLKVYDVLGRVVADLINEEKPAGTYSFNFDASNLNSGIYFYRIEVNGYINIKSMTLLK